LPTHTVTLRPKEGASNAFWKVEIKRLNEQSQ